ncbi:hypothetical protein Tter_1035 [Thermobaculum terrenum ATCC BAA-798]|uniref:YtxH domain-containing protein n=1 Tax=Thermobaculum terrenum (strain ATCC BAA-798 / CCMEE 7001 / YNP1) TaxID=525904 RepID=D1CG95_THET1|nr:YtxH domain-containing protein [Thermobaculum terrenum]ACZ41951.1 hypothetical protein Tter_1035 [Thermobaculum terrenum ATCC BAA-798]
MANKESKNQIVIIRKDPESGLIPGFILGLLAGVIVGLLQAPSSGRDLREKLLSRVRRG